MSKDLVNVSGVTNVALNGFDPVTFFTVDGKPTNGDFTITAKHRGAIYFFASEENKTKFESDPDKYAPQVGGFCAYGVSIGALAPVDVSTALIYKDKLYMNLNPAVANMFGEDLDGAIAKAEKNWPELVAKSA